MLQQTVLCFFDSFNFSSPNHKVMIASYWGRSLSVVKCRVSTLFSLKHILWNQSLDFDQTSQKWSLCAPSTKQFHMVAYICNGVKKIGFKNTVFIISTVWNHKAQSFYICLITSSRGHKPTFSNYALVVINGLAQMVTIFSFIL